MRHKLRIGLLIDNWNIPAWQHGLLVEILNSDYASIDVLIQSTADSSKALHRGLAVSIYDAVQRFEKRHPVVNDACDIMNARKLLSEVDRITIPSGVDSRCARERASKIANIESQEIDVILALNDISSIDSLVDACKYGVWFYDYCYSSSTHVNSSWIGFRETLRREPPVQSALMVRSAAYREDRTAYISYSSVSSQSHATTRSEHLWKIRAFVPRVLKQLYVHGGNKFLQKLQEDATDAQLNHSLSPINLTWSSVLTSSIIYALWRIRQKVSRSFFNKKWILMFQIGGNSRELDKYTKMRPPKDWLWADPFVVRKDDHYHIFFEEASVESGHGHISVIQMDESGNYSQPERILERPYHLSYPFIFEWQRTMYMIPETAQNRTVEVYKCKSFPDVWEFECRLIDNVSAYDATLFEHDDTWWLFANIREHDCASTWDELYLFSSDNPLGDDWQPHPMNPIVSDVRSARPAGKIFRKDGRIYRPSQNSSFQYGYGLNFSEILELTKTTYTERVVVRLEPNWDPSIQALHTFNGSGELTVIDAIHRTRKFARRVRRSRLRSASKDQ